MSGVIFMDGGDCVCLGGFCVVEDSLVEWLAGDPIPTIERGCGYHGNRKMDLCAASGGNVHGSAHGLDL